MIILWCTCVHDSHMNQPTYDYDMSHFWLYGHKKYSFLQDLLGLKKSFYDKEANIVKIKTNYVLKRRKHKQQIGEG